MTATIRLGGLSAAEHQLMDSVCNEILQTEGGSGRIIELEELVRFGFSGARVYRATAWRRNSHPSLPFVVKVAAVAKIRKEFRATKDVAAHFQDARISALVEAAECSRAAIVTPLHGTELGQTDVEELGDIVYDRRLADDVLVGLLGQVYEIADVAHGSATAGLQRRERILGREYSWYLRGRGTDALLKRCFGADADNIESLGVCFENPLRFIHRLLRIKRPIAIGIVHGDLHPSNALIGGRASGNPAVHLVDFGWGKRRAHVLKDYVLMEWSLRFLRFPPFFNLETQRLVDEALVDEDGWKLLADAGHPSIKQSGLAVEYRRLGRMIGLIRKRARAACGPMGYDFGEYQLALYFVLYGLLKHPTYPFHAALRALGLLQMHMADVIEE